MKLGLSYKFQIKNGKFEMTGGGQKASDNVSLVMNYTFLRMNYYPDFNPGTAWLIQKPVSYLFSFRTLILARVKASIEKYVIDTKVNGMNIVQVNQDRKNYAVYANFTHTEDSIATNDFNVTFI
jgi:hypothetical protein